MSHPAPSAALSPRATLAHADPTAPHTLRAQSVAPPLLSPSRSLTSSHNGAGSAGVPLTHAQSGVQPVLLYSKFTSTPRAPLTTEEKSAAAESEAARRDPYGSSVELNSFSRLSRTFRSQASDAATLAGRRRLQQAGREQARAQREWDAQLHSMLESNGAHTHAIALMHEGVVALARHHAKVDAQLATAAAPANFAAVERMSGEDERRSPNEMLSPASSVASLSNSAKAKDRRKPNTDSPTSPSAGDADGSAAVSVIAMRRRSARANARLKASALSRRHDFFSSNRPLNPFLYGPEGPSPAAHPMRPALSHDAILSREQALVREVIRHAQKNEERFAREQQDRAEEAGIVLDETNDATQPSVDDPSLAQRTLSGIDPAIYRPSALFSPTTLDLLSNPYYTEPSPSGHPNPSEGLGRGGCGADPQQYLQKGRRQHFRARAAIETLQNQVETNLLRDFAALNREDDSAWESTNDQDRALAEIVSRSHAAHKAAVKAKQLAAVIGMGTADLTSMQQQAQGEKKISSRTAPKALQLAGMDLFGAGAGRSHVELGEAARLARALPYAVRIVFRSARVRMQRAHVLYMMGCLPGVVAVQDVLFSPDLRQVYIAFTYNRFSHAGAAVARAVATSNAPGTGVECDGVAAVRVHLAALTASLPTPYLAAHKARNNAAAFVNNGVLVSAGEQDDDATNNGGGSGSAADEAAHTEMLVLLRFLLESAHVDESSLVQMQALRAQWSQGHNLPHVREPSALLPAHTLPLQTNRAAAANSNAHHPYQSSPTVSAMSQDTQHMFSPRSGHAEAASARRSQAATAPASNSSSRPLAAGSKSARRGAGRTDVPQLQWADGLFGHVGQQTAQQEIVAAASAASSSSVRGRSSAATASATTKGSLTARAPLGGMVSSASDPQSDAAAHYSASIHRRIAMPPQHSASHTAFGPNSLARNAQAPPPVSMGQLQREATEAHRARTTILDPASGSAAESARPLSASVFVPRGNFFRSEGTMSDLSLTLMHPSAGMPHTARGEPSVADTHVVAAADEERILRLQTDAIQRASEERLEAQRMHARVAPVRGPNGQQRDSSSLRALARKQQTTAESQKRAAARVASNLKWTLTAQLEGVEA